ncbi:histidinol-phosphatase [Parvibaculum sp.]|uniref:histidinol-phosphatase n=1 Tax=Parvibaculum sp. TaxID=2024848 RepID=UPI001D6A0246|nr:histidinol-phosphatase [Parvibaculum sp.]MBX3489112.1 histidinol-phosphatase [Parvibaculum sp.]MCW5727015.1 histidinol-phosphatase [Parvibaculum sp.]
MLSPQDIDELAHFALELGEAAAAVTLPHFRSGLSVDNKRGRFAFDPVTAADRDAEAAIRKLIGERYPDHGVLGEEHGNHDGTSGLTWVIDPIDGTRSFISGVPLWGTLIALNDGARPVIGLMEQPYIGEKFLGRPGGSELIGPKGTTPLKTSACTKLEDALLGNTDPGMFRVDAEKAAFRELTSKVKLRRFGGDCYFYCLLAAGTLDLVVESSLEPYDIQALIPIIENAGGVVTSWSGGDAQRGGQVVAAANTELHAAALKILSPAANG